MALVRAKQENSVLPAGSEEGIGNRARALDDASEACFVFVRGNNKVAEFGFARGEGEVQEFGGLALAVLPQGTELFGDEHLEGKGCFHIGRHDGVSCGLRGEVIRKMSEQGSPPSLPERSGGHAYPRDRRVHD